MISVCVADRYTAAPRIQAVLRRAGIAVVARWTADGRICSVVDGVPLAWIENAQASLPDPDLNILLAAPTSKANAAWHQLWKTGALAPGAARKWQIVNGEMSPRTSA